MNSLSQKIRAGRFVVTTELTPPKGIDLSEVFERADALKGLVDAINLTESPRARMAIEPTAVAKLLLDRGIEPIVQFTTRDRNRIALQADILGAAALGVGNAVFMMGDDPRNGDHSDAKAVHDLTTIELLQTARALNHGRDLAGNELKGAPSMFIGATANPAADDFDREIENVRRKVNAGAQFLQTQAMYDAQLLVKFLDALRPQGVAVLAGIIPLKSSKMAQWLNANVPGIRVPAALIAEMEAVAGDAEAELRTSIDICARIIRAVRSHCAGIHLMAMGWEKHIPAILRAGGLIQ
ncbi:MAG TPA: methylenetetrahydrofolate reductase [Povalibacter sp.]|nr:methylenetetrahydrofolate reductase [Povalibacter sp.]